MRGKGEAETPSRMPSMPMIWNFGITERLIVKIITGATQKVSWLRTGNVDPLIPKTRSG
jgi:hypothetical protein